MERVKENIFYISSAGDHTSLTEYWHSLGETSEEKDERMQAVINRRNHLKYTPLHCAIYARNLDTVNYLLEHGADPNSKCHGTPCLHLVLFSMALPGGDAFGIECSKLLIQYGTDLTMKDDQGSTALHIACDFNLADVVELLLETPSANDLINAKDKLGMRPLHRCAIRDSVAAATVLLSHDASIISHTSNTRSSPLHIAATHGACGVWKVILEASHRTPSSTLLTAKDIWGRNAKEVAERHGGGAMIPHTGGDPVLRTLEPSHGLTAILTHPLCRMHHTCPPDEVEDMYAPPENIKRLSVLLDEKSGILRLRDMARCLRWIERCRAAPIADVLRVHEWSYIRRIQAAVEDLPDDGFVHLDSDTAISRHSFAAAMHAAGAVCQAVDMVLAKEVRNAFCAVRPPGHHAGPIGLVASGTGGDSHGFCLLNNISIAAAYAMSVHRDIVKTVAIVDFDVHHGNGTEETLRWLVPAVDTTEIRTGFGFGAINTPRYKPWYDDSDVDRVMFVSVHGFGPRDQHSTMPCASFYPGTGKTSIPPVKTPELRERTHSEASHHMVHSEPLPVTRMSDDEDNDDDDDDSDWQSNDDEKDSVNSQNNHNILDKMVSEYESYKSAAIGRSDPLILNIGESLPAEPDVTIASGEYRHAWRNCFREQIFPRLLAFKPDLILISAGFDAHKKDTINGGYLSLVEEDYEWLTEKLVQIANTTCEGRIVSALEGGYQTQGEYCSAFAKSVRAHVWSMCSGGRNAAPYLEEDIDVEKQYAAKAVESFHAKRLAKLAEEEAARAAALAQHMASMQENGNDGIADDGERRKRRRQAAAVDYAALSKELGLETTNNS